MSKYLIDTNIFIDALRGQEISANFLRANYSNSVVSYITFNELIQGADNKKNLINLEELISLYEINYSSSDISRRATNLVREFYLKNGLKILDAIIASTALELNLVLITQNIKHFKFIKGIKVENLI